MRFFEEFRELAKAELPSAPENGVSFSNPVCGDEVTAQVVLQGDQLASFRYSARGCWPVMACLSWLRIEFQGKPIKDATTFTIDSFLKKVEGVPASKRHAFSLSLRALQGAAARAWLDQSSDKHSVGPALQERL